MAVKSLRRRLFTSHLLVMVVALVVLVAGTAGLFAVAAVVGELGVGDVGRGRGDDGPRGVFLLVPLTAAVAASALVSWWVTRRLSAPVEAARGATTQMAAGCYGVRVDGGDTTELAALADDINHLAAELEATEKRRLRLIGDVAHELRNPLATIEASMEALMDGVVPADYETFAGVAREAARLRRLAGDLSQLSATAEPSLASGRDPVDLIAVVAEVVDNLTPQATAKSLTLAWAPPASGSAMVRGERDRLVQVFTNVIGNAVQYTDQGSISVDLEPVAEPVAADTGAEFVITVADTGRGLTADDQHRIFERFYRAGSDPGARADRTGVGLAIARAVVDAHGGSITARSAGPGHGARFEIRLPSTHLGDREDP